MKLKSYKKKKLDGGGFLLAVTRGTKCDLNSLIGTKNEHV